MKDLQKNLEELNKIIFEGKELDKAYEILYELKKIKFTNETRALLYNFCVKIAKKCVMEGMFKEAIRFWEIAYKAADIKKEKLQVLNELGFCFLQLDEYKLAKTYYKKIIKLANKKDLIFIESSFQIGEIYSIKKKFKKALRYYFRGLKILCKYFNDLETRLIYQKILLGIFVCYYKLKKYTKALKIFDLCIKCKPDNNEYKDAIYGNRGHMHRVRGEYKEAIEWYKKAIEACEQLEAPTEKIKQINEKQKEYWQYWLKECEKRICKNAV